MDETEFIQLLESLLKPDTERVKEATATLKTKYYSLPAALSALVHLLISSDAPQLKQLAAVEARKLVSRHWTRQAPDRRAQIRNDLLQAALNEENTLVRHSIARLISAVAKLDLSDGDWSDLPEVLHQAASSQVARHREISVYILFALLEANGELFADSVDGLLRLLCKTVEDPESVEVRLNSMLALSRVAMILEPEESPQALATFQEAIPRLVLVLKAAIDAGDEDHVTQAFEVFQTLLGCDAALLQKHFGDLVVFMIDQAGRSDCDDGIRSQAFSFLMQCVRYRKLKVQALKLGEQLTLKSLEIVTELGDSLGEEDDISPARSALGLLDVLASNLPPSQVIVPLLKAMGSYCQSPDPNRRRAGILALGMCVEGAPDFIETQLQDILTVLLRLLEDENTAVRAAALSSVARLADDLPDDMGEEHARLIPPLVKNFDAAVSHEQTSGSQQTIEILRNTCQAVDSLIEGLAKENAATYASELIPRMTRLFGHPDLRTRLSALGALGAIAAASEEAFWPYFESTMPALGTYILLKGGYDDLEMRGVACDTVGKIASAVGAEKFKPFVHPLMQASEEALHLEHPRLRETSYILWSTLAQLYGPDFEEYLGGVVRALHDSLHQAEAELEVELGAKATDLLGAEITIAGRKVRVTSATDESDDQAIDGTDDAVDENGGDDDDDDDWDDIGGASAVAMEKEIAIDVIGDVLTYTKTTYMPYLDETIRTVLELVDHSYEGVRKAAIGTLWRAYASLWGLAEASGLEAWKPGLPLKVQPPENIAKLGHATMTATLTLWEYESDRGTVTEINRNIAATVKLCGPAVLVGERGSVAPTIVEILVQILNKRHPCQQDLGEEIEEEVLEEASEYDWLVIETALDTITSLSVALGEDFCDLWPQLQQPILRYASSHEHIERSAAVGSLADCIKSLGTGVTPFTRKLLAVILHRLSDEDPETKSNAAYALGLLCENSRDDAEVLRNFNAALSKLESLLHDGQHARLVDNAAGCVGRMIMKHPTHVPLEDVLPKLIKVLPLQEDYEENEPIFNMIVSLYQSGHAIMKQATPLLKPVFEKVLGPPEEQLKQDTRGRLAELIDYLRQQ